MDVPILVLDALSLFDQYPSPMTMFPERLRSFRTSAAPYFDARCGIILDSMDRLEDGLHLMRERLDCFRPREFVLENLSLEKQAREFVSLFRELEQMHGCTDSAGVQCKADPYVPRISTLFRVKLFNQKNKVRRAVWRFETWLNSRL